MNALDAALRRFVGWMRDGALPFWAEQAWDGERGGFYEALDFDGRPIAESPRRVRVQARQVHVFANAARLGWDERAERLALDGSDYLARFACPDGGRRGCVSTLAPDGAVLDARRDLYDQAFLLLACAGMTRAFGPQRWTALASRTLAFLDRELADPAGGYREDDRASLPRRQNPHMHLFEAYLALAEATGTPTWRRRADDIAALFATRFFDAQAGVLREFFDADWNVDLKSGDVLEPGHMMEWVVLLARHEALGGAPVSGAREVLYRNALVLGADGGGFLVDRTRLGARASGSRRLWPQTEYLKAALARAEDGDDGAAAEGAALIDRLFATYLAEPVKGLWCDRFAGDGARMADEVPASILYHLFDAAVAAQGYLERRG